MGGEHRVHLANLSEILWSCFVEVFTGTGSIILLTMCFDKACRGLTLDIDAETVAHFGETFGGGIVGCADKVHVGFLKQKRVGQIGSGIRGSAKTRMNVVAASTAEFHRLTVDEQTGAVDFYSTETHPTVDNGKCVAAVDE